MIKIKLFFLVLFLSFYQLSFSFAQNAEMMVFIMDNKIENQFLSENINITGNISGEFSMNQFDATYCLQPSKCFLSNNTKDLHFSTVQGNLLFNSVKPSHLFNSCLCKKVINVPIYLQTEKFRL